MGRDRTQPSTGVFIGNSLIYVTQRRCEKIFAEITRLRFFKKEILHLQVS